MQSSGLDSVVNSPTFVGTVFAPTDAAFETAFGSLGQPDPAVLTQVKTFCQLLIFEQHAYELLSATFY